MTTHLGKNGRPIHFNIKENQILHLSIKKEIAGVLLVSGCAYSVGILYIPLHKRSNII